VKQIIQISTSSKVGTNLWRVVVITGETTEDINRKASYLLKKTHALINAEPEKFYALALRYGFTLDIGCGPKKYGNIGIDIKKTTAVDVVASAEYLPFKDGTFDTVFCCHVLEHVPAYERAVEEAKRVTRCQLIVVFPKKVHSYANPDHVWHFEPEDILPKLSPFLIERIDAFSTSHFIVALNTKGVES